MYNGKRNGFHFDFDPYDYLIQLENRQIELENKHNLAIRNQKEMALMYNDLSRKYTECKKKLEQMETDLWRAKSNDELIQKFYKLLQRPERN